jgi:cobalt-zinc-cadmium efflux system outer membrane protein
VEYSDTLQFDDEGERALGIELSQEFEIGGQGGRRTTLAELALSSAREEFEALQRRYLADVTVAFWILVHAEERLEIAAEIVALNQEFLSASERRLAAGDIAEVERNLISFDEALARSDQSAARAAFGEAQAELQRLLGRAGTEPIEAIGSLPEGPRAGDPLEHAEADRLDLEVARIAVEMGGAEVDLLRSETTPDLELSLGWERDVAAVGPDDFLGDADLAQSLGGFRDRGDTFSLGLSFPIPLFNNNRGGIEAAAASEREAGLRVSVLEDAIQAEINSARAHIRSAGERLELFAGGLPEIERNLGLLGVAFRSGYIGAAELLTARDGFVRAQLDYLDARLDYATARVALARALGIDPRILFEED